MTWLGKKGCTSYSQDIVLLELKEEDELDLTVYTPACLARSDDRDSFDNKIATVAGWGVSRYINSTNSTTGLPMLPDPLEPHEVDLTVRPVSVCPGLYDNGTEKRPSVICAGLDTRGKSHCMVRFITINDNNMKI